MNDIVYAGRNARNKECKNRYFEVFVPDGAGICAYGGGEKAFNAGDVVVVPPSSDCTLTAEGQYALLEKAFLPVKEVTVFPDDKNGGMRHALLQAEEYFESDLPKKDIVLSALGSLIAGYVAALCERSGFSPVVGLVLADVSKNLSNPSYALDDFLKKLPLNYDYVRKLFKKEVGATPHGYLIAKRMSFAAELLAGGASNKYSNYSVSQVAEACGFSEPLYFSRVFKKYYGVSPSEYKE